MIHKASGAALNGSQHWIQQLVNHDPHILTAALRQPAGMNPPESIDWRSPLASANYAEYSDDDFVNLLGLQLTKQPLEGFWPRRGPHWDALGVSGNTNHVFLVEAKAHVQGKPFLYRPCVLTVEEVVPAAHLARSG